MALDLGSFLLTEVRELNIPKILSMRDTHLRSPSPESLRRFLTPPEGGKELRFYEVERGNGRVVDYFIGNGNKRAIALELAGIELPESISTLVADPEAQYLLERNAQAFHAAFAVRTVREFVQRYLPNERLGGN